MIDDRQERALEILGKIQESMVKDLIEDLVQNEENYTEDGAFDNSYNFSLQDLEDTVCCGYSGLCFRPQRRRAGRHVVDGEGHGDG